MSRISFRSMTREDMARLSVWLAQPHVEQWWRHEPGIDEVEAEYGPCVDGDEPTEVFIVYSEDDPIGLIQRYRLGAYPAWQQALSVAGDAPADAVGIDYLIGEPTLVGQGIGSAMIRQFVEGIWDQPATTPAVIIAVQQENTPSWRALEKVGFLRTWAGTLTSDHPSDDGPSFVYRLERPQVSTARREQ